MKKVVLLAICAIAFLGLKAQDVSGAVDARIAAQVAPIKVAVNQLDSIVQKVAYGANNVAILMDTLWIPSNYSVTYRVDLKGENVTTKETCKAYRIFDINNVNGTYSLISSNDIIAWPGRTTTTSITKASWGIVKISAGVYVIQVTGLNNVSMQWSITRTQTYTSL